MTTLRQLSFLVALADTLSFSRAAEHCHVTQSTLSTGLKQLEDGLGVQLAERTRQSVLMTPVGADLAKQARSILAHVQDFEDRAKLEVEGAAPTLRLGAIPTVGPYLLPKALPIIRERHPGMKVLLREELTDSLLDGLINGRLDLVLIALPQELPDTVMTAPLFFDGYKLATPRTHPLANLSKIEGSDLDGRELLLLDRGHCLQEHALSAYPSNTLRRSESVAATSLQTLIAMVEEDVGITLLPDLAVSAGVDKGHDLALIEMPDACPREVVLAWRRSSSRNALFKSLGDDLTTAWQSMGRRAANS
jgi:LysR family hydrogen peroxide-inducible transcriptional activator